jgi:hypothetical protein
MLSATRMHRVYVCGISYGKPCRIGPPRPGRQLMYTYTYVHTYIHTHIYIYMGFPTENHVGLDHHAQEGSSYIHIHIYTHTYTHTSVGFLTENHVGLDHHAQEGSSQ